MSISEPPSVTVSQAGSGCGHLRLQLLNGFGLQQDGHAVLTSWGVQRLLAYMALNRSANRHQVAGELWPDVTEQRAHGSLRTVLWRLQAVCHGLVSTAEHAVTLHPDVTIDVEVLMESARGLRRGEDRPEWRAALLHGGGELLPGWYDEWVLLERERMRQLRLHALEDFCTLLLRQGCFGEAVDVAFTALRTEPMRESVHRLLIEIYLAEGNHNEARRQYREYASLLRRELGEAPSPRIAALFAEPITSTRPTEHSDPRVTADVRRIPVRM